MSIRKRTWKTAKGEPKDAWVFDYVDQAGKRRLKTFKHKKAAEVSTAETNCAKWRGESVPIWLREKGL